MNATTDGLAKLVLGGRSTVEVNDGIAVKRLTTPQSVGLLRREVWALTQCRHPALPRLLGWDEPSGTLRMTSFDGPNLEEYVRDQGPLPEGIVARLLSSIAGALRQLHNAGLFHLDVKPRNIVIERRDGKVNVGLVDLGSCGGSALPLPLPSDETKLRRLGGGAFLHSCPDQLFQRIDVLGEHWDAFALGVTAFYAHSGRWPTDNDTERATTVERYHRLLNRFPAYRPVPEAIRSLLDPNPATAARTLRSLNAASF